MPALRYAKNLRAISREADGRLLATRIFPRGANEGGIYMTMADHRWPILAIDGATVTIGPDETGINPLRFVNQVQHLYAQEFGTTAQWRVLESDVDQTFVLEDEPDGLEVGEYIQFKQGGFCIGHPGADLTYIDNPAAALAAAEGGYGLIETVIDRPEVPPVDNLVLNPFLSAWPVGNQFPDNWSSIDGAGIAISRHTSRDYRQFGLNALSFLAKAGAAVGMQTDWISIRPTAERPFFTFQMMILILFGVMRFEVELDLTDDASETLIIPDPTLTVVTTDAGPGERNNTFRKLNLWTHAGIAGLNLWDDPAIGTVKRVRLRLLRESPGAQCVLDAAMATQTAGGTATFYDKLGSNVLWHQAVQYAVEFSQPRYEYHVNPVDLFRADQAGLPFEEFVAGTAVPVFDEGLGVNVDTRLIEIPQRDLAPTGARDSSFKVATRIEDLTRILNPIPRFRVPIPRTDSIGAPESSTLGGGLSNARVELQINPDLDGKDYELLSWDHNEVVEDDGGGRFTIDVTSTVDGAFATGRNPKLEYTGGDAIERFGSVRVEVFLGSAGSDPLTVNVYRIALKDGGTVVKKYATSIEGYYQ